MDKDKKQQKPNLYLLLDVKYNPIARGELLGSPDAPTWQVRILDGKIAQVCEQEKLQLVCMSDADVDFLGRVIQSRGDCIILERQRALDGKIRQNLRMPVGFSSVIYPITGTWRGQRTIKAHDLSCGGIAFLSEAALADRERLEVVIPITDEPLVLRGEVLRRKPAEQGRTFYALKFVDLCRDEEVLVRKAVFNIQLRSQARRDAALAGQQSL
jgi:hypothetical protein